MSGTLPDLGDCWHGVVVGARCRRCGGTAVAPPTFPGRVLGEVTRTSREAHASLGAAQLSASQRHVLEALTRRPMTNEETWADYQLKGSPYGTFTPERLRGARAELARAGRVKATGEMRPSRTGRRAEVYAAVLG